MVTISLFVSDAQTDRVEIATVEEFVHMLRVYRASCLVNQEGVKFFGPGNMKEDDTYKLVPSAPSAPLEFGSGRPPQTPTVDAHLAAHTSQASLALQGPPPRKATCRMWKGDKTVYALMATSFDIFDREVKRKYPQLGQENEVSYYYIKNNKTKVETRTKISNDNELNDFFDLAGKPTIYIWPRASSSNSNLSPGSLPSQVLIHHSSAESMSDTSDSSSSRGHVQTLFRKAVRDRDNNTCVLSGEELVPKSDNLEAAHIMGVEPALADKRRAAGVLNPYDTTNGMLLTKSLHVAFDSYLWCMDESLKVHISEDGKNNGLGKYEGEYVTLRVNDDTHSFPPRVLLKARFDLYEEKCKKREAKKMKKKRTKNTKGE